MTEQFTSRNIVPLHGRRGSGIDGGAGGPHPPDMEARVAKLESDVAEIKAILGRLEPAIARLADDVGKMRLDLAEVKGKVSQMPTTIHLLGFAIAIFTAAGIVKYFGH